MDNILEFLAVILMRSSYFRSQNDKKMKIPTTGLSKSNQQWCRIGPGLEGLPVEGVPPPARYSRGPGHPKLLCAFLELWEARVLQLNCHFSGVMSSQ